LPPITNGELEFYDKKKLRKAYDEDQHYQTTRVEPLVNNHGEPCEPALHFHEFLFLLGLIAYYGITTSTKMDQKLQDFYIQKLNFRKPTEQQYNRELTYDEILYRTSEGIGDDFDLSDQSADNEYWTESDESEEEPAPAKKKAAGTAETEEDAKAIEQIDNMTWDRIKEILHPELPQVPPEPVVE